MSATKEAQPEPVPVVPATQVVGVIEADDAEDEAYASDAGTNYSASVTSSIRAYRQENGRTYHAFKDGSYWMPNDESENDRLDFQHAIFLRSLGGKLFRAPIPNDVQEVLDVGTGTGIWAIDFADEFPSARVTGTDLSPTQPSFVPPNLTFYVEDMESQWGNTQKYDFIHGRALTGSFKDPARFFKQAFENLKPGGYLEMQDSVFPFKSDDGTLSPDTALYQWLELLCDAVDVLKRPMRGLVESYKTLMAEAGFVDIEEVVHKWPLNRWPKDPELKEIGMWNMQNILDGLHAGSLAPFTRGLGWERERVEVLLMQVRKDVQDRGVHAYIPMHFVHGRKPEAK